MFGQEEQSPPVLVINVAGTLFTTSLSTLCRYPGSYFEAKFSGRYQVLRDSEGRPFIDYDPELFQHILSFLRTDALPPPSVELYHAATYFGIDPLREQLSRTAVVSKYLVKTGYRDQFDSYSALRSSLIKKAIEKASRDPRHCAKVNILIQDDELKGKECDTGMCLKDDNHDIDLEKFKRATIVEVLQPGSDVVDDDAVPVSPSKQRKFGTEHDIELIRLIVHDLELEGFSVKVNRWRCSCSPCSYFRESIDFVF